MMSSQALRMADSQALAGVTAEQAARFAEVFHAASYSDRSVADSFGALEMRGRGGKNLPRLLYLTREPTALNTLARLFLLGVSVPLRDAAAALGPLSIEDWADAGFIEAAGEEVRGLLRIFPFDGLLLAIDPPELLEQGTGPDFVSGLTNSSAALMCCTIPKTSRTALDLGTGSGVLALLAARRSERIWATDVNPRALSMARLNARLNGVTGIEFALGSGFEPVRERKFDFVITNPPFVLGPLQRYSFRDSGMDLDGLCRKLAEEAPRHLEEGGYFQCQLEWPNLHGVDWKEHFSGWFRDSGCDALVLRVATTACMEHAEETAVETDVCDLEVQTRLLSETVAYFEQQGVESIGRGFITLRRRTQGAPNWIQFEEASPQKMEPFGDAVLRVFETHDFLEGLAVDGLLDTRVRLAPGVVFETGREWSGKEWSSLHFRLRQPGGLCLQANLDSAMASLVQRCDGSAPLRQILSAMATGLKVNVEAIVPGSLQVIRSMMERGFLTTT
ncbi:MAG: class I SAM-dependent methyltransferase [Bryobacteraceae bacterium]|nr:class I SAM-dependent methyltransferase [Bryobacteraceae bacterium]